MTATSIRKKIRMIFGVMTLAWASLMFLGSYELQAYNTNALYSAAASRMVDESIAAIDSHRHQDLNAGLKRMKDNLVVTYEDRGNFKELADKLSDELAKKNDLLALAPTDTSSNIEDFSPVPMAVIASLPNKIELLPTNKSMRVSDFLEALEIDNFRGNISGSVRFNSLFMKLDAEHLLQIRCDPDSLVITKDSLESILNSSHTNPARPYLGQDITIVGCTLRKNWNDIIISRWLEHSKTAQLSNGQPDPCSESKSKDGDPAPPETHDRPDDHAK